MAGARNDTGANGDETRARPAVDRRTMLKTAAAVGAGAVAWTAPRIETLGFTPAAAQTPCVILSPGSDDKNLQEGQSYCPIVTKPCCDASFGNAGQIDRFTFLNPAPNCTSIVIRTIALDCNTAGTQPERNPDVGQFAVVIESTTGSGCSACTVFDAVLVASSGRAVLKTMNNGPVSCPPAGQIGDGVDASLACDDPLLTSSSRLAVRLHCVTGSPGCTPP